MDNHPFNDWSAEETATNGSYHEAESPFALAATSEDDFISSEGSYDIGMDYESPFLTQHQLIDEEVSSDPNEVAFAQFLDEIHDEEFSEGIIDLASEGERYLHEHFNSTAAENEFDDANRRENILMSHYQPVVRASDELLDHLSQTFSNRPAEQLTEGEIDEIIDRFVADREMGNPVFEDFFRRLARKVKKVAKRVVSVAKKGINLAKKFSPAHAIMGRIKSMARRLFGKIVRRVINKMPGFLRGPARLLAKKFGIQAEAEMTEMEMAESEVVSLATEEETTSILAGPDYEWLEREFDLRLTEQYFARDESEADRILAAYNDTRSDLADSKATADLNAARQRLVQRLQSANTAEEVQPHVEEFIGVALRVLKIGIRLIGRQRVINLIAKLFTKLIARLIGQKNAAPLARALVEKGFSLLNLEVSEAEAGQQAAENIVQVLEEVVQHVSGLDAETLGEEELIQQEVLQYFNTAIAQNFPSTMVQEEFRESEVAASWVLLPLRGRKRYKKYSRVINVQLEADQLRGIRSFGGEQLQSFLRRRHGVRRGASLRVRIHIYEAIRGTTLSHISLLEKIPGLGSARRSAWTQIHPLTPTVAGQLVNNPRLGKRVAPRWLSDRNRIIVGQRLYYLEIQDRTDVRPPAMDQPIPRPAPVIPQIPGILPVPGVSREEARVKLDFTRSTITLGLFITEDKAANISRKLRAHNYVGAAGEFRSAVRNAVNGIVLNDLGRHVEIVKELEEERYLEEYFLKRFRRGVSRMAGRLLKSRLKRVITQLVKKLVTQIDKALLEQLRTQRDEFIRDQENPARGISIHLRFVDMPGMAIINTFFKLRKGEDVTIGDTSKAIRSLLAGIPKPDLFIHPGKKNL